MEISFDSKNDALRQEVRAFLAEKLPEDLRLMGLHERMDLTPEQQKRWARLLADQGGWGCPGWPKEHGGPGWSFEEQYLFERELALGDAPRLPIFGPTMIGQAVIEYGTDEQKARFLPAILSGEILFCQGFSEPNAGSDLAALKCHAAWEGEAYIINGSKIWTSDGHFADWMFGLFRTDGSGKKQHGITVLLLPMDSPGIEVRPLVTFDGTHEVNQTFFTDVRVPVSGRLGEEHRGWAVAKYILWFECFGTAEVSRSVVSLERLKSLARGVGRGGGPLIEDSAFAARIAEAGVELRALELLEQHFPFGPGGPDAMGPEASMLKIRGTEVQQKISELTMEALGGYSLPFVPEQLEEGYNEGPVGLMETGYAARSYFNLRKSSIHSGSNEIQKNILAKAVLGL
jgi:alkylation response protein AidB-like acyl-CoA dehydrogenase